MQIPRRHKAPSVSTIKKCVAAFKRERWISKMTTVYRGRPSVIMCQPNIDKVLDVVIKYRRKTVQQLAIGVDISVGSISQILHSELGMSKVSARWVTRIIYLSIYLRFRKVSKSCLFLYVVGASLSMGFALS